LFGIAKEAKDLNGPSEWSWTDINADLSGIEFAERLLAGSLSLKVIQRDFKSVNALADPVGLEEKVSKGAFEQKYKSVGSPEVNKELERIQVRVKTHIDRTFGSQKR
jgi:hypothetical protein